MNYLLHIDTSSDTGSIALALDGNLISTRINTEARNHASSINLMIDEVLAEGSITLHQLSAVVVCAGPGSYTGLRIGVATAKGLCYALNIPLLLDNKLTLLANQAFKKYGTQYNMYVPVLLAREKEYFVSSFDNSFQNIKTATHIIADHLAGYLTVDGPICIISDFFNDFNHLIHSENIYIYSNVVVDLEIWATYSLAEYKCNNIVNLSTAEPFYLKQVYTHK